MLSAKILVILCLVVLQIIFGNTLSDLGIPIHLDDSNNGNDNHNDDDSAFSQEEIHLEDFFWTGSGDGPPDYVKNVHTGISKGKNVIVKTETVVATVYVDGKNDVDSNNPPLCIDCENKGLPVNFTTTDRRYWLLTVISGFFRPKDHILLADKLAQLYRLAFTRQQSKHLGIENGQHNGNLSNREKREQNSSIIEVEMEMDRILNVNQSIPEDNQNQLNFHLSSTTEILKKIINENSTSIINATQENILLPSIDILSKSKDEYKIIGLAGSNDNNNNNNNQPSSYSDYDKKFKDKTIYNEQQVQIVIHNVTLLTEDDVQNWDESLYEQDMQDKRDSRPLANQTEIIYSVFVNGKPVLATTAAEDMKLLTENEVTTIMEKIVFMKAEPYLKEPQATPLVPASKSAHQEPTFLSYIQQNPVLVVISSVAMMLVLLLLLALLLMTRAKRQRSAEIRRLSSRNGLLQQSSAGFDTGRTDGLSTIATQGTDGAQNYGFEDDKPSHKRTTSRPHISFPIPPNGSRPNSSSTVSTSDSSVYCPVNRPNLDLQHMLDEKAANLFDKKNKNSSKVGKTNSQLDGINKNVEPIYTSVVSGGGGGGGSGVRKRDKKHKHRRRYLSENRVGSIDEVDANSSAETSLSTDDNISDSFKPDYQNFEHNEAYNLHNNYHRNKILQNQIFTDKIYDSVHEDAMMSPTEAINREIIKALQPTERSSENNSIGSFLSMTSVKSFPRSTLPEPLNRVLEPVSVTYYDHYDEPAQKSSIKKKHKQQQQQPEIQTVVSSIEENPSGHEHEHGRGRERERKSVTIATQSDNPDPGVLGPIVWEIHKKKLARNAISLDSPMHDPAESRFRFEGLLEGAIELYDDSPIPKIKNSTIEPTKGSKTIPTKRNFNKENRGKSAIVSSGSNQFTNKKNTDNRPFTAGVDKSSKSNQSTQPPSPSMGAWSIEASSSPLVRPLSAGPFHRPQQPNIDITRILVSQNADKGQLSAAPLIEAIQNELKKFKRDQSQ